MVQQPTEEKQETVGMATVDLFSMPSEVPLSEIGKLAQDVTQFMSLLARQRPIVAFDDGMVAELRRHVPPSALERYADFGSVLPLVALEISDVGNRIHRYQYIERYTRFMKAADAPMFMAFVEHIFSMRMAEIYLVGERAEATLRFIRRTLHYAGVNAGDEAKKFATQFRKQFARRLRERHRMTHFHERPSLLSRLLSIPSTAADHPETKEGVAQVASQIVQMLKAVQELQQPDQRLPSPDNTAEFREAYLRMADGEAEAMWRLFSDGVGALLASAGPVEAPEM